MSRRTFRRIQRTKKEHVQKQSTAAAPGSHPLMELQRSVGSQAVQRLIHSPYIQGKLQVSSPHDQAEVEADRTAANVMTSREGENSNTTATPGSTSALDAGTGDSNSLPTDVRAFMEPRLGADLSGVRVHTDDHAAQLSEHFQAKTFTYGKDIYFGAGHSPKKDALTAHELVHVNQQTAGGGNQTSVGPNVISRTPDDNKAKSETKESEPTYWFQNKPPEKPKETEHGITITPKGQVVLDPAIPKVQTSIGTIEVQFAGMDSDFHDGTPTPQFASAEKAVLDALAGSVADLGALPDIKDAEPKVALAQRHQDEVARARLKEAARTLSGRRLNIFIATDLSVAEKMSMSPLSFRTEQIFVRPDDIGNNKKLEAAIRVPLIALTGGKKGFSPDPSGGLKETTVQALSADQSKEAILHELVHVMLVNQGASAVQISRASIAAAVSGPSEAKKLAEDVLFRYVRAQEEIFVYSAIGEVYSGFKANKDHYDLLVQAIEAFLKAIGARIEPQKPIKIDVKEKIGTKGKEPVTWTFTYRLPKDVKVDKDAITTLKELQKFDIGS